MGRCRSTAASWRLSMATENCTLLRGRQGPERARRGESGLSPRVRGNRLRDGHDGRFQGSIPAGAGEPGLGLPPGRWRRVYPRGCGGTGLTPNTTYEARGLSPRVRGNLEEFRRVNGGDGSIPAGAGEPVLLAPFSVWARVYPRGCGGTTFSPRRWTSASGLSPRVRGNRRGHGQPRRARGSIPAGAGEPCRGRRRSRTSRVYPRGCGGTGVADGQLPPVYGLSPRVRGNHRSTEGEHDSARSIPAGAGEPVPRRSVSRESGVYPRGCGGTAPKITE